MKQCGPANFFATLEQKNLIQIMDIHIKFYNNYIYQPIP